MKLKNQEPFDPVAFGVGFFLMLLAGGLAESVLAGPKPSLIDAALIRVPIGILVMLCTNKLFQFWRRLQNK